MQLLQVFIIVFFICLTKLKCATSSEISLALPRLSRILNLKERVDLHKSANYILMPHIYRAFIYGGASDTFLAGYKVSQGCQTSLQSYYEALQERKSWAWKMYDSTGKQAAGVFLGATTWTGNYRECLGEVRNDCSPMNKSDECEELVPLSSQFCSVHMTHAPWMPRLIAAIRLPFPVPYSPFIVDVCVPAQCSDQDISKVVGAFLAIDNFDDNLTVTNVYCHSDRDLAKDAPAILCVVLLFIILALVILGTLFDIYRRRRKLRVKQGPEITIGYDEDTEKFGILKILVPPRKRKRRRGTLSSSEPFDHNDKLQRRNVQINVERSRSENLGDISEVKRPVYNRMPSAPATHIELENIPENSEIKSQEDSVISTSSTSPPNEMCSDKEDTDYNSDDNNRGDGDVFSEDGNCEAGETSEAAPMTPSGNSVRSGSIRLARKINRQHSIIEVKPSHKSQKMSMTNNLLTDLLLSFSFRKNTRHILAEGSPDTLFCLNGVRVLSIAWIVLGNVYGIIYQSPEIVDNHVAAVKMTQTWWMQMVINTTLAADSFFVLSGTLGAYHFMKVKTKAGKDKEKNWRKVMSLREYLFTIVHRLVRILPCYAVLLMLGTNLMPYLGDGPRWSYEIENVKVCKKNWWSNILFISNFYDPDNMCLPHTYYLANDFQFFLFSPLVLIPLLIKPKLGLGLIGFFVTAQVVVVTVLNQGINGNVLRMRANNYWSLIYVKPYSRMGVYCIGLGLGYCLFICDRQMKFKKIPLYIGWFVTVFLCILLPYVTLAENREGGRKWTGVETALYEAFSRPAWALSLSWIIFCCSTNQGGFIGKLLSWNLFLPLCRITYGVFLLHPILIAVVIESEHHNFYLSFGKLAYIYIPLFVCSYLMAFLLISCVECPFTSFESYIRLRFKAWNRDRKMRKLQKL